MISDKFAGRIIIVGLVCGVLWLGNAMVNSYIETSSYALNKR